MHDGSLSYLKPYQRVARDFGPVGYAVGISGFRLPERRITKWAFFVGSDSRGSRRDCAEFRCGMGHRASLAGVSGAGRESDSSERNATGKVVEDRERGMGGAEIGRAHV